MTTNQDEIAALKSQIAGKQRDCDDLLRQYGSGVRPGWVSTDLAINRACISAAKAKINALRMCDVNKGKSNG